ncbi:MAG: hypothetical protein DYG89_15455 [Caldilinea sp. CFX5]|nr:hypothetical protein [Caldilinea sp. CFX5]
MGIPVLIEVPEPVYEQAAEVAGATRRGVGEVLQEMFIRSFPPMYDGGEEADAMEHEIAAYEAMHAELWAKYPDQFVAIYAGQVIDVDADEWQLLARLEVSHPDDVVLVRQVKPELPGDIVFRSPRFVFDL